MVWCFTSLVINFLKDPDKNRHEGEHRVRLPKMMDVFKLKSKNRTNPFQSKCQHVIRAHINKYNVFQIQVHDACVSLKYKYTF